MTAKWKEAARAEVPHKGYSASGQPTQAARFLQPAATVLPSLGLQGLL